MAAPHADRNLCFGILAIQVDSSRRDALIAGMNAVSANRESLQKQARCSALRHQGAVTAIAGLLLTALVGFVVGLTFFSAERRRMDQAGQKAEQADDPAGPWMGLSPA